MLTCRNIESNHLSHYLNRKWWSLDGYIFALYHFDELEIYYPEYDVNVPMHYGVDDFDAAAKLILKILEKAHYILLCGIGLKFFGYKYRSQSSCSVNMLSP